MRGSIYQQISGSGDIFTIVSFTGDSRHWYSYHSHCLQGTSELLASSGEGQNWPPFALAKLNADGAFDFHGDATSNTCLGTFCLALVI